MRATLPAALLALTCCRPPPPPPTAPRQSPIYLLTPDRLYTTAPVGDGVVFVEVVEKVVTRRPGGLAIELAFPEIALSDDDRERELAKAIREAGRIDDWIAETGKDAAGTVEVVCTATLATTSLISVVCESRESTRPPGEPEGPPPAPKVAARTWQIDGGPVRPLGWDNLVLPGVTARMVLGAAVADLDEAARDAWLTGECAAEQPEFTLDVGGLMIWPTALTRRCDTLRLGRDRLQEFLVPNGLVARTLRVGAGEATPNDAPQAEPDAIPASPPS